MRSLPKKKSEKQKLIIKAVYDYYGQNNNQQRANQVAIYLMGRKKGVDLTEEEMSELQTIKTNLADSVYIGELAGGE
jgi:hypothetical protein